MLRGSVPMRISASSMSDGWIRSGLIRAELRACGCIKHISVEYQSRRMIRGQLNPKSTAVEEVSHSPLGLALTSLTDQSKMRVWVCRKPVRSGATVRAQGRHVRWLNSADSRRLRQGRLLEIAAETANDAVAQEGRHSQLRDPTRLMRGHNPSRHLANLLAMKRGDCRRATTAATSSSRAPRSRSGWTCGRSAEPHGV